MIKKIGIVTVSLFVAASLLMIGSTKATAEQAVNAKAVAEHMDKAKYSSKEIKSYMKDLKSKEVTAEGKIDDILNQPKKIAKVVVHVDVPGKSGKFVVDVHMPQDSADKLRKGETVSCKGEFRRYNPWTLNGIVLEGTCKK